MNLKRIFFVLAITTLLLAMTTQVFASTSVNAPLAKPTKKSQPTQVGEPPSTPGANGAENSNKPDKARGKHEHYKGTIANIDPASITLTLKDGSSVTIGLSAETSHQSCEPERCDRRLHSDWYDGNRSSDSRPKQRSFNRPHGCCYSRQANSFSWCGLGDTILRREHHHTSTRRKLIHFPAIGRYKNSP